MAGLARAPFRLLQTRGARLEPRTVWALRNVSFEVRRGEVLGIIGRNGAGKSTLLKILSRITEPTEGTAEIRGRVGSLLEVGTGFHGELTGRENVFLNGAILGMPRGEISAKFDEIVSFAEVETFIDTPVKRYSSGMYLRLAFAVAAHLEPDILIVDEVLAVGDARFQAKCLNKMRAVGQQGRTVLFVSHNMPAVTHLCERAILLEDGMPVRDGPAADVVREYLRSGLGTTCAREWSDVEKAPGRDVARLRAVRVRTADGRVAETLDPRYPIRLEMEYEVRKGGRALAPYFSLANEEGVVAFTSSDLDPEWRGRLRPEGIYRSTAWIPGNLLADGTLFATAGLTTVDPEKKQFRVRDVVAFQAVSAPESGTSGGSARLVQGVVRPLLKWSTEFTSSGAARRADGQ
jgi:homopolymeric O-antigen transport system ATP-binding protein